MTDSGLTALNDQVGGVNEGAPEFIQDLVDEVSDDESPNFENLGAAILFAETIAKACSRYPVLCSKPLDSPSRGFRAMFKETGKAELVERAVEAQEEAVKICPPNHDDCAVPTQVDQLTNALVVSAQSAELPLHAAGHYFKGANPDKKPPQLFISSYAPSLGAMIRARRATAQDSSLAPCLLVISQPATKGEIEPNVKDEIPFISKRIPTSKDQTEHPKPSSPPSLVTHGCLEVLDILRTQNPHAELAVLTACHTASTDTSAPDELLHLAGAMQFAKFRSVVGTSWATDDSDGSSIVKGIYRRLFEELDNGNRMVYTCVAKALNEAVEELRMDLVKRNIAAP
ncbi:hypothetical protein FRB99_000884 [Tulasnella sp. 403]|nr:hypothetical protein FRB99_000884 [Tulasnella sp. 403]